MYSGSLFPGPLYLKFKALTHLIDPSFYLDSRRTPTALTPLIPTDTGSLKGHWFVRTSQEGCNYTTFNLHTGAPQLHFVFERLQ